MKDLNEGYSFVPEDWDIGRDIDRILKRLEEAMSNGKEEDE